MPSWCARCYRFGDWKKYKGKGTYHGRTLCVVCRTVASSKGKDRNGKPHRKPKTKKD
jgi:hypothetical protein